VSVRKVLPDPASAPTYVTVAEFRCPGIPDPSKILAPLEEAQVLSELASDGLHVVVEGSPTGNRTGCSTFGDQGNAYFSNETIDSRFLIGGITHSKYICATRHANFGAASAACGASTCCYDDSGNTCGDEPADDECTFLPALTANDVAIESTFAFEEIRPNDHCTAARFKNSTRIECGGSSNQGHYPYVCDANTSATSNNVFQACAGMVVTHVTFNSSRKELRHPYWSGYAMDGEKDATPCNGGTIPCGGFQTKSAASYDDLKSDCRDFTVADLGPVPPIAAGDCLARVAADADHDGTIDACEDTVQCSPGADAVCDDAQYCNGVEWCSDAVPGGCHAGAPPNCDDGIACTFDSCNEAADSCDHTSTCPVGEICQPSGECAPPPCPIEHTCATACNKGNVCILSSALPTSTSLGADRCLRANGQLFQCPSGTPVIALTTPCSKCACCSATPACFCPSTCPSQVELTCGPQE
jgi:hypothetical protein